MYLTKRIWIDVYFCINSFIPILRLYKAHDHTFEFSWFFGIFTIVLKEKECTREY
jgi:hypothetical protein